MLIIFGLSHSDFVNEFVPFHNKFDRAITESKRKGDEQETTNLRILREENLRILEDKFDVTNNSDLMQEKQCLEYAKMTSSKRNLNLPNHSTQYELVTTCGALGQSRRCGFFAYSAELLELIIAIKGTKKLADMLVDIQLGGQTHSGFAKYSHEIFLQVSDFLKTCEQRENIKVVIVGHSLGAAGAYILTNLLCNHNLLTRRNIKLRTYALPKNCLGDQTILDHLFVNAQTIDNAVEKCHEIDVLHYGYAKDPVISAFGYEKKLRNFLIKQDAESSNGVPSVLHWLRRKGLPHYLYYYERLIRAIYAAAYVE